MFLILVTSCKRCFKPLNVCMVSMILSSQTPLKWAIAYENAIFCLLWFPCYVVDFGGIIQGGLNVTFATGHAGQQVTVFAGETLYADGSVKWWEDNLNDTEYRDVWTLREGRQTITSHEYFDEHLNNIQCSEICTLINEKNRTDI